MDKQPCTKKASEVFRKKIMRKHYQIKISPIEGDFSLTASTKHWKKEVIFMRRNFTYAVLQALAVIEGFIPKLILAIMGILYKVFTQTQTRTFRKNGPYAKIHCTC